MSQNNSGSRYFYLFGLEIRLTKTLLQESPHILWAPINNHTQDSPPKLLDLLVGSFLANGCHRRHEIDIVTIRGDAPTGRLFALWCFVMARLLIFIDVLLIPIFGVISTMALEFSENTQNSASTKSNCFVYDSVKTYTFRCIIETDLNVRLYNQNGNY